jgi:drug/metabolite transporter (DMT)-like permease
VAFSGWFFLGVMILSYGVANLLQSIAAARTDLHPAFSPRLLLRLGRQKAYLAGLFCQFAGFALALLARRDLPLFLVQSAVAAGLGVTALLGVLFLKWRLPKTELGLLVLLCSGIAGLIVSARRAEARPLGVLGEVWLVVALVALAILGFFAVRLHGSPGSVTLGSLAGIGFGAAAVASRPLASASSPGEFLANPLLYLVIAHSVVGQLLLGMAMQRGSTTAAVAGMDAAAAVPAAAIGLLFLGDGIVPGREWLAATGFLATLGSVLAFAHYAKPQQHRRQQPPAPIPLPGIQPEFTAHPSLRGAEPSFAPPSLQHPQRVASAPRRF